MKNAGCGDDGVAQEHCSESNDRMMWHRQSLWLAGSWVLSWLLAVLPTTAQISGDGTLETQVNGSLTNPCTDICIINGGNVRGTNLYHSFKEFSIPANGQAWFNNTPQIQNILTRVTGNSISNIDGLIKANDSANLFFLNPNGIIFGPNARLQIGGSFFASTANSFKFSDGSEFSAVNPQSPPLLAINLIPGLQYGKPIGSITQAGHLVVPVGQNLTLFGDTISNTGSLTAPSGTVHLLGNRIALLDRAQVDVSSPTGGGTVLIGGDYRGEGTLPNATQTFVDANVTINAGATSQGNGGKVIVWANGTTSFYGTINARGGELSGDGGFVEVSGAQNLAFQGSVNTSALWGQTGTLLLDPTNITVVAGAIPNPPNAADGIWSATEDVGDQTIGAAAIATLLNTTSLNLQATNSISVNADVIAFSPNDLTLQAQTINVNNVILAQVGGGNLVLDTTQNRSTKTEMTQGTSVLVTGGLITTDVQPGQTNRGGDLQITTGTLNVIDGALLRASTFGQGDAGNVKLNISGVATFDGGGASSTVGAGAVGNAGNVEITAGSLLATNEAVLRASTFGIGDAGNVKLTINGVATFDGIGTAAASGVAPGAIGNLGNVEVTAGLLSLANGAELATNTYGRNVPNTVGKQPGGITITADSLAVTNGAQVNATTFGQGNAGGVKIAVSGAAIFDGTDSDGFSSGVFSNVNRNAVGNAGGIELTAGALSITNGARLNASSGGQGNAGGIKLTVNGAATLDGSNSDGFSSGVFSDVERNAVGNAGGIELTAEALSVTDGARLDANSFGAGNAGSVRLTVSGAAIFDGVGRNSKSSGAGGEVQPNAVGNSGDVELTAGSLSVTAGAQLGTGTFGRGNAGSVKLTVSGAATFDGIGRDGASSGVFSNVEANAQGKAGGIEIGAASLSVRNGAVLDASTFGRGDAGGIKLIIQGAAIFDGVGIGVLGTKFSGASSTVLPGAIGKAGGLEIVANSLTVANGAQLNASTLGQGDAGSLVINTRIIQLIGATSGLAAQTAGSGRAGNILLQPLPGEQSLSVLLQNEAQITASTLSSQPGGNIIVTAPQSVILSGIGQLSVATSGKGAAGNIVFNTPELLVQDGTQISASTSSSGRAGDINIIADRFDLSGSARVTTSTAGSGDAGNINANINNQLKLSGAKTGLFASTAPGSSGKGGNITIDPRTVLIQDQATIGVDSQGSGQGGNIAIQANRLELRNDGSITAETASTQGGNIKLNIQDLLLLRRNSLISATAGTAQAGGNGGNITINAPRAFIVAVPQENSDIAANAFTGRGGNVQITAQGVFGLQFRPQLTPFSDITASSQFGVSGVVTLNILNVDPNRGLIALPTGVVDPSRLIIQRCAAQSNPDTASSFYITGRGGLPYRPGDVPSSQFATGSVRPALGTTTTSAPIPPSLNSFERSPTSIVEATHWALDPQGNIFLVADAPTPPVLNLPECPPVEATKRSRF